MPQHFARRWLAFDETRPTRSRRAKRFVAALLAMLAAAGALAWLTAR